MKLTLRSLFVMTVGAIGLGCSSGPNDGSPPPGTEVDASASTFECASDPRVQTYTANLEKMGVLNKVRFTLTAADPAPPRRGLNDWTLHVADPSGAAISQMNVTISGTMPDHQHGWSSTPVVTQGADGMTVTFGKIYFSMAGVWAVTFEVHTQGGGDTMVDTATFTFCIG
jgi:YtkA-like